jgi:two-component system, NtrC family, nitrogen regulation response regulator NtrX
MKPSHILIVDDEPDIAALVGDILTEEGHTVSVAGSAEQARAARRQRRPDLVLLDIWLPDTDGVTLLKEWTEAGDSEAPVIMMSGHATLETAVEATRLGAYEFLEKPLSTAKLLVTVSRALEADALRRENVGLRRGLHAEDGPVGSSAPLAALRAQVERIASRRTAVLITGESGSGKETFARFLHRRSPRASGPFVAVGAAALARENPEAELFGAESPDGRVRYGWIERANGGTLLLKDIADLDLGVQARLLTALENQSTLRLGGSEPVALDVHIVAATRHDLLEAVREGRFRDDLYYHLSVVPLAVPALREHLEDIPELVDYYLRRFVEDEGLPPRRFSAGALARLRLHPWPGNVRELRNLVQRLLILGGEPVIEVAEVEQVLGTPATAPSNGFSITFDLPLREAREQFERVYLEHQLQVHGGSVSRVAEHSGMERTHLYRKLRSLGLGPRQGKDELT